MTPLSHLAKRSTPVTPGQPRTNRVEPICLPPLTENPLVSILSANRNYADYLSDSIESVLRQSYAHFEFVVCDDGSTDGSRAILNRYRALDARVKPIFRENGGQAAALNAAFQASRGEIVCFLDSDDLYAPEKLRAVVDAFAADPQSGFAIHRLARVNSTRSRKLGEIPLAYNLPSGWLGGKAPIDAPWVPPGMPPCTALALRRAVADRIFPLPAGLLAFADTPIQVLAPLLTPVVALDSALGEYRIHGQNAAAVPSFSEAHLRRLVEFDRELWFFWRGFLAASSCEYPIPTGPPVTQNTYVYARFRGDPAARQIYAAFISGPRFRGLPALYRGFWKFSSWLPDWAFRKSFEIALGQKPAKRVFAAVLRGIRRLREVMYVFDRTNKRHCPKIGKPVGN